MDQGLVNQCPLELDLTKGLPDYVLNDFTDDTCLRKKVKVCYYCKIQEDKYEIEQFCRLNLRPGYCHEDNEGFIGDEVENFKRWRPGAVGQIMAHQRIGGYKDGLPEWYRGRRPIDRQEAVEQARGPDLMKVPGTNKVNVVTVIGHCSQCT